MGCLIYSDPADDGYAEGDSYPRGGARPAGGVQRGSVADMTMFPGDPLTPGVGATPGAKRLTRAEAPTLLKIPTLPISYADASKIIAALDGPGGYGEEPGRPWHDLSLGRHEHGPSPSCGQIGLVLETDL